MNNKEVCDYVQTIDLFNNGKTYISELCVNEGFGQSCGGYLELENEHLSQKEHFLNYYGGSDKAGKLPSYNYLRCPQLLLFIAELAGVSRKKLENAYEKLQEYEINKGLKDSKEKNGNYLCREQILKDFKAQLCIHAVVKIIKNSKNWDEVKVQTKEL